MPSNASPAYRPINNLSPWAARKLTADERKIQRPKPIISRAIVAFQRGRLFGPGRTTWLRTILIADPRRPPMTRAHTERYARARTTITASPEPCANKSRNVILPRSSCRFAENSFVELRPSTRDVAPAVIIRGVSSGLWNQRWATGQERVAAQHVRARPRQSWSVHAVLRKSGS